MMSKVRLHGGETRLPSQTPDYPKTEIQYGEELFSVLLFWISTLLFSTDVWVSLYPKECAILLITCLFLKDAKHNINPGAMQKWKGGATIAQWPILQWPILQSFSQVQVNIMYFL